MTKKHQELKEFCKQEKLKYADFREKSKLHYWPKWTDQIDADLPFDEIFRTRDLFYLERPFPGASKLKKTIPFQFETLEREKVIFQSIQDNVTIDSSNPDASVPFLYSLKQALEDELGRFPEMLESEHEALRSPMKAWLYLTARDGLQVSGIAGDLDSINLERRRILPKYKKDGRFNQRRLTIQDLLDKYEPLQVLLLEANLLWREASSGFESSIDDIWEINLSRDLQALSEAFHTPPILVEPTQMALLYHVRRIRNLRDSMLTVDVKRAGYDLILHRVLTGMPAPEPEEFADNYHEDTAKQRPGRPYDFPIDATRRWYDELITRPENKRPGSQSRIIREIVKRHKEKTKIEPHFDTIRDQVRKIKRGG